MEIPHILCTKIESSNKEIQLLNESITDSFLATPSQEDFFADLCFFKSFEELEQGAFLKDAYYLFALHKFYKKEAMLQNQLPYLTEEIECKQNRTKDFTSWASFCRDLGLCSFIAEAAGQYKLADSLACKMINETELFNKKFFDCNENTYPLGVLLPLAFNLAPIHRRIFLANQLNNQILSLIAENKISLSARETSLALKALCQFGFTSTAYSLFKSSINKTSPFCLLGFISSTVLGINWQESSPGFSHIVLRPNPIRELESLKVKFKSPYGKIEISCSLVGDGFLYCFEIPRSATAILPSGKSYSFPSGNHKIKIPFLCQNDVNT